MRAPVPSVARNLIFFGGDNVSRVALEALHQRAERNAWRLHVVHPPSPAGTANVVAAYCREHGVKSFEVDHAKSLKKSSFTVPQFEYDATVVVSCRYFLPDPLLRALPPAVNMHPSLLPRYRGASPIYETLRRGDSEGGASIIKLCPGELMDSGDILEQRRVEIPRTMDLRQYFPLVTSLGSDALVDVLDRFEEKWHGAVEQPHKVHFRDDPTHAPLIGKHPGRLAWDAVSGAEAFHTWRAFVGYAAVGAVLDRAAAPCGTRLKSAAKRRPVAITFQEALPCDDLAPAVLDELKIVEAEAAPGAAYFPWTLDPALGVVGLVRCAQGWFCYRAATVQGSQPVVPKTLAATLECKRGLVYNGVFAHTA